LGHSEVEEQDNFELLAFVCGQKPFQFLSVARIHTRKLNTVTDLREAGGALPGS
jgi:hypothetical protein